MHALTIWRGGIGANVENQWRRTERASEEDVCHVVGLEPGVSEKTLDEGCVITGGSTLALTRKRRREEIKDAIQMRKNI